MGTLVEKRLRVVVVVELFLLIFQEQLLLESLTLYHKKNRSIFVLSGFIDDDAPSQKRNITRASAPATARDVKTI